MAQNVVPLMGGSVASIAGEPEPDVIAWCEALLERARSGETIAIASVEVRPTETGRVLHGYSNPRATGEGHLLMSGLYTLQRRLDDAMD